ncbi:LysR family transcriptional regulator [Loigolactobacillus binensis]|uniref:LysR family transcriptional regulator n=1 Tax=Loigolactobacillus binensis TaxID=2559922 RepID=A0ABW3EFP9_9LACO|nr:LysR family transcriptional regulator [Loigolactobacillus binensis]
MDTNKLYEFLLLSRTLNYSKAATSLYIAQSVLTRHIQEMEAELQLPLFTRTTHHVQLTPAGQVLAQQAAGLINDCDHAISANRLIAHFNADTIRIACVLELAHSPFIQRFINQFRSRYQHIELTIDVLADGTTEQLLQSGRYDIIFTPCEFITPNDQVHACLIQRCAVGLALYPEHPLLARTSLTLADLAQETLLVPFADELFGPYAKNWKIAEKYTHNQISALKVGNLPTALLEVAARRGVALVPEYANNLAPRSVVIKPLADPHCRYNEYIYYNQRATNNVAQVFYTEFCQTYVPAQERHKH